MRLSKNNLILIGIIPIVFGLIIYLNFIWAINKLEPGGKTAAMIYYQLLGIATAMFIGAIIYWALLVHYINLMQESEALIQDNFTQLAGSGTAHLQHAKKIIGKVLDEIKSAQQKPQQ